MKNFLFGMFAMLMGVSAQAETVSYFKCTTNSTLFGHIHVVEFALSGLETEIVKMVEEEGTLLRTTPEDSFFNSLANAKVSVTPETLTMVGDIGNQIVTLSLNPARNYEAGEVKVEQVDQAQVFYGSLSCARR